MEITLDIPESAQSTRREGRYYKEALVAMLYQSGDLSSKESCQALGISRREFEEMLLRFRVSIMSDGDERIATELNV